MAIANYTDLTSAVVAWLDVSTADIPTAVMSNLVTAAGMRIMREVRTTQMETSIGTAIASGVIAVPSDYIELKYAYVNTNPIQYLQMVPPAYIYQRYPTRSSEGVPVVMARDGSNFIFGPFPDSGYEVNFRYYMHLPDFGAAGTGNGLFVANPDLYLWASLSESEPLIMRDPRIAIWESKYAMVKGQVNGEANRSHFSGNLMVRPG